MRAGLIACGLVALVLSAPAASAQASYGQTRALNLFNQLVDNGQCEAALPEARTFWPSSVFQQLGPEDQSNFLAAVVQCAWFLQDGHAAIAAANAAHERGADWADKIRLVLGFSFDDDALSVQAFFDLADHEPKQFADLETYNAWGAIRAAEHMQGGDAVMLRMYDALISAQYKPPGGSPDDPFRLDHARLLLQNGEVERARSRLDGVVDPQSIMTIRINRLYDPLRADPAFEQRLDVSAAAEASIARARRIKEEQPRRLSAVVGLARDLRDIGRSAEALAEIDRVLPAAQAEDAASHFDDLGEQLHWLLSTKAELLYDLGRNDEARDFFGTSMSAGLDGSVNVNQTVDFAGMLNGEGRGADALQVLRTLSRLSVYGDMWLQSERACAADQTGDRQTRDEALAALRAHEADNAMALSHALLCVNDVDGAAALMIRRLNNPKERESALVALQRYHHVATRRMPREALELQRLTQVRERPDVIAAAAAVGRIEDSPLFTY